MHDLGRRRWPQACVAQLEALPRDGRDHPQAAAKRLGHRIFGQNRDVTRTIHIAAE